MLTVIYAECHLCRVSNARLLCSASSCCYAKCRYAECRGATFPSSDSQMLAWGVYRVSICKKNLAECVSKEIYWTCPRQQAWSEKQPGKWYLVVEEEVKPLNFIVVMLFFFLKITKGPLTSNLAYRKCLKLNIKLLNYMFCGVREIAYTRFGPSLSP
jgi:hypothetical protein